MAKMDKSNQYKVTERVSKGDKYQRESYGRISANLLSDKAFETAEDSYNHVDKESVNPSHMGSDLDSDQD